MLLVEDIPGNACFFQYTRLVLQFEPVGGVDFLQLIGIEQQKEAAPVNDNNGQEQASECRPAGRGPIFEMSGFSDLPFGVEKTYFMVKPLIEPL